jgi:bifunctional ADP-heptose synthase (sugar kinase/adenylyltransferase)
MKNEKMKEKFNRELSRLSRGFSALNSGYKKGVLKTAQGLLRIQRKYGKPIPAENRGNRDR